MEQNIRFGLYTSLTGNISIFLLPEKYCLIKTDLIRAHFKINGTSVDSNNGVNTLL